MFPPRAHVRGSRLPGPDLPGAARWIRSEEHTSELQSHHELVCRLLLEKKTISRLNTGHTHLKPSEKAKATTKPSHSPIKAKRSADTIPPARADKPRMSRLNGDLDPSLP